MTKSLPIIFLLALAIFKIAEAEVALPWAPQMSGEQIMHLPGGRVMTSKIYVDNGKVRVDAKVAAMSMSTILLPDKKMMYSIMPAQKMVMELPLTQQDKDKLPVFGQQDAKFELVGQETVQGVECDKYKLNTGAGRLQNYWVDRKTKFPVLMQSEDGGTKIEWRNVVAGPQPAALFEPPADYQRVKVPQGGWHPGQAGPMPNRN